MKRMLNNNFKKKSLFIVSFIWLALIIWQYGPNLVINHQAILQEPQRRIALILTLALAWLTKIMFSSPKQPSNPELLNLTQMQQLLRGHFLGAMRFLKKTFIDKHGQSVALNKLPWYLLIGPPSSGKTTLLANSNINFILSKQYKNDSNETNISTSTVCDWWVTRDLVLVDVPGSYTFSSAQQAFSDATDDSYESASKETTKPHLYHVLWKNLLNLLTKYRQKNNLGAIVVALNIPELIKQPRYQQTLWFQEMKQRLNECWGKFGKLPVYFIITKCDLLPGFSEFFNDIGSDELTQAWGIPFGAVKEHENLLDVFTARFNALVKRLNKQLIWRLHQERDPQSRLLIKEFPLQLEHVREVLSHLIKMLVSVNAHLDIPGIYLTSAAQENAAASAATLFHQDVPSSLQIITASPFISRVYFIKHLISYILPHTTQISRERHHPKTAWLPKAVYSLGLLAVLLSAMWLGRDFHRSLYQISSAQHDLGQYQLYLQQNNEQTLSIASAYDALPLLDKLEAATQHAYYSTVLEQLGKFYSNKAEQAATNIYYKALQNILLPPIKNEFEKYLQSADDKNPEQIYTVLKAYLMLKDKSLEGLKSAQNEFIIQTLLKIAPDVKKELMNKSFALHVKNALHIQIESHLDTKIITHARKILNAIASNELGYILLKNIDNNGKEIEINLGTNIGTPATLISKGTATLVPYMYTATAYPEITKNQITLAAEQALTGNDIIGKKSLPADTLVPLPAAASSLAEELQKNYLAHYVDVWESLTDNISLNTPHNLTEIDAVILNLISGHSPLLQLLQTIHANTNIEAVLANSFRLQALNVLFNQTQTKQKDSLYQIFVDLHELHLQLHHTSAESSTLSEDTITRIHAMADHYPEPIKNWLQTLVSLTHDQLRPANTNLTAKTPELAQQPSSQLSENKEPSTSKQPVITPVEKSPNSISTAILEQKAKIAPVAKEPELPTPQHKTLSQNKTAEKKEVIRESTQSTYSPAPGKEYVQVVSKRRHPMILVEKS